MFISLRARNFASFKEVFIDFSSSNKRPKNSIFIYGENGSGKSNIVSMFDFLNQTVYSLLSKYWIEETLSSNQRPLSNDEIKNMIFSDQTSLFEHNKMIGSTENAFLEYTFEIEGKIGIYSISFSDSKIEQENLKFVMDNNIAKLFDISDSSAYYNPKLFMNKKYKDDFSNKARKYQGKHTVLSVLAIELKENNIEFMKESIHPSIIQVLDYFQDLCVLIKGRASQEIGFLASTFFEENIMEGTITPNRIEYINKLEESLSTFFQALYSDVKGIYYEKTKDENRIKFKLFFRKMIGGKIVSVPYDMESTGTYKLLDLYPLIIEAINGHVVVIDELDTGIHDILIQNVIQNTMIDLKGQLIITTHNTLLLNNIQPSSAYVIDVDRDGNKIVQAVTDYKGRIQRNHNLQNRYLLGAFNGVPNIGYLNLGELASELCREKQESGIKSS